MASERKAGRGRAREQGRRLIASFLALCLVSELALALSPGRLAAEPPADASRRARIAALEAEREQVRLSGSVLAVVASALLLQGGLSTIVSAQYNCPGYWDCSDEARWGITGGAGAAILAGTAAVIWTGRALSRRLRIRHDLDREIHALKVAAQADRERLLGERVAVGFVADGSSQAIRLEIRF